MGNAVLNVKKCAVTGVFLWHYKGKATFPGRYAQCLLNVCSNFQEGGGEQLKQEKKNVSLPMVVFLFQKLLQHFPQGLVFRDKKAIVQFFYFEPAQLGNVVAGLRVAI